MGFFPQLMSGDPELLATPQGASGTTRSRRQGRRRGDRTSSSASATASAEGVPGAGHHGLSNAWQQTIKAAEAYNEPGRFTAFIGFEWTSNTGGNNLHRNVVFRGSGAQAGLVEPYTTQPPLGSDNPVDLWKWMAAAEQKTGSEVLAIAHNGNLSNGRMFPLVEAFGKKRRQGLRADARQWEPLYETTQTKGTGEAHPFLSPNDEFATSKSGTRATRRHRAEDQGHARLRVRALGAEERAQARSTAGHQSRTSSA
jgi:hypothetical protein